jgi:hypothetical protein
MADELRTDTSGLARRIANYEIENVRIHLEYDPRLTFYLPERWWVAERFDIHAYDRTEKRYYGPHIAVWVAERRITWYSGHKVSVKDAWWLEVAIEVMGFARDVLVEA